MSNFSKRKYLKKAPKAKSLEQLTVQIEPEIFTSTNPIPKSSIVKKVVEEDYFPPKQQLLKIIPKRDISNLNYYSLEIGDIDYNKKVNKIEINKPEKRKVHTEAILSAFFITTGIILIPFTLGLSFIVGLIFSIVASTKARRAIKLEPEKYKGLFLANLWWILLLGMVFLLIWLLIELSKSGLGSSS